MEFRLRGIKPVTITTANNRLIVCNAFRWIWYAEQLSIVTIEVAAEETGIQEKQSAVPLPADERRMMKWNGNPYTLDYVGGGAEEDPTIFLLPYLMGRYHGLIWAKIQIKLRD